MTPIEFENEYPGPIRTRSSAIVYQQFGSGMLMLNTNDIPDRNIFVPNVSCAITPVTLITYCPFDLIFNNKLS
jgi:hypothetical protein